MKKTVYKMSLFAIYRMRLFKYLRRHYRRILNISYFTVLVSLMGWTLYYFFYTITADPQFRFTTEVFVVSLFCGIGFVNFLVAYTFALVKEKQVRDLTQLVMIDELTEIFNKRYFLSKLHTEIVRSRRYGHIVALIVLDIDHFKKLNDTYGHMCGDVVLRSIARIIKAEIRMVDVLCRFGGEEFVVICPETSGTEATIIGERIRKRVEQTKFRFHGELIRITISGGINQFDPLQPKTEISLFNGADQALYLAKNEGRNRVVMYTAALHDKLGVRTEGIKRYKKKRKERLSSKSASSRG